MNGKEFRLGNMIYYKVGLWGGGIDKRKCFLAKITGLYGEGAFSFQALEKKIPDAHIFEEPIPLTEDWLLKLGFEKHHGEFTNERGDSCFTVEYFDYTKSYHFTGGEGVRFGNGCKYVHQLQNLYFALTGEELTIKDIKDE